ELFGDAVAVTERAVAGRAVNIEALAPALEQRAGDGQRIGLHKICRAGDAAGVDWRIFKGLDLAAGGLQRLAARNRAGWRQLRTEGVREKVVGLLRAQFQLPVHVRENLDGRLARQPSLSPGDADAHGHARQQNQNDVKKLAHQASTSSMCVPPRDSSSLRVSVSENFGSFAPMTRKNLSRDASVKRAFCSSG